MVNMRIFPLHRPSSNSLRPIIYTILFDKTIVVTTGFQEIGVFWHLMHVFNELFREI